ncbi:Trk system potassium transporter TrkA [Oleispirillum naphthae]|uniref:Trk system potassium transporter TrkA n=1 Tax=Oleispirillum naphthae TaxID=2838853 RepID=UPI0030823ACA
MRVLICGAGQVGFNIARYLAAEDADITVVDRRPDLIRKIQDQLDVQAVVGHAAHPATLEQAGANTADMLIAVTPTDEVNMVACQVAHSLFKVPTKIARVRSQSYLSPIWADLYSRENVPIDVIISPEYEVAQSVTRLLEVPGALDVIPLCDDKVRLVGARASSKCPILNTPLRQLSQLFPELSIVILGIIRDDKAWVPTGDDIMQPGDDVYFITETAKTQRALAVFGHEDQLSSRVVIFGGGNIGLALAKNLEDHPLSFNSKLIEMDEDRAEYAAKTLSSTVVIHGDALDADILEEAGIKTTDTVVAITDSDETNILASLLAKRHGVKRAITLTNKPDYSRLVSHLGIDTAINPRDITVSTILQHVRRGRIHSVHALHEGFGELIEADALETSELVGKSIKSASLPHGVLLGAIVRDGAVIIPRGNTTVQAGDRVVLFADADSIRKVEKLFAVRLTYI